MRKLFLYSVTLSLAIVLGLVPAVSLAQAGSTNTYLPIVATSSEAISTAGIGFSQSQALLDLIEDVRSLNLKPQLENGLIAKLEEALKVLTDDNPNNDHVAINKLRDFIKQVDGQRGSSISEIDADALIATAEQIIASLVPVTVDLNDRNAYEKGAHGVAVIDTVAEGGIIKIVSLEASELVPGDQYYVWRIIQDDGAFDPVLDISPNLFRSTVTANNNGGFSIAGTFPGPAAALQPGLYRVDIFVTPTVPTQLLDEYEANLIRSAHLYSAQPLAGLDLLLSSAPFSTGIEVTVPK